MKNVSWASRAGWLCGWNSASKFQNELSTNWLVGISSKPISSRILRNSVRTAMSGCSEPPPTSFPRAARLQSLKDSVRHSPLRTPWPHRA